MKRIRKDLSKLVFGRLTVIKQAEDYISPSGVHLTQWLCKCGCSEENEIVVLGSNLTKGRTRSCGCLRREDSTNMCKNPNDYEVQEDYVIMYTHKGEPFYVDLEDFWKVKNICWRKNEDGYIVGNVNGKTTRIHRLIMNCQDGFDVDHKYGKQTRHDNRKYNLRIASRSQNNANRNIQKNNTSGTTGVSKHSRCNKWTANIWQKNRAIYLGLFETKEEAIAARKNAENKYYGEFSYENSQRATNLNQ